MLLILNAVLIVVDLIWLLSVGSIWTGAQNGNDAWNHLHGLHCFAIFISVINLILKIVLVYLIHSYKTVAQANEANYSSNQLLASNQQQSFNQKQIPVPN